LRRLVELGTSPDSAREWANEVADLALDPELAAEAAYALLMAEIDAAP
jgi:hypothetical protein